MRARSAGAAIGMCSGYYGSLVTLVAVNFNLVPLARLELPDPHAIVRAHMLTALLVLGSTVVLLYLLAFRGAP